MDQRRARGEPRRGRDRVDIVEQYKPGQVATVAEAGGHLPEARSWTRRAIVAVTRHRATAGVGR
jgi:hypothetical protein